MQNKKWIPFLFVLMFCWQFYAQEIPVSVAFSELKENYNIDISYVEDDLRDIFIMPFAENLSLNEIINHINAHPLLACKKINANSIAVKKELQNISVCGVLRGDDSKEVLVAATVKIVDNNSHTITNNKGQFFLEGIAADARVEIDYLGYKKQIIAVSNLFSEENCPVLYLNPSSVELNEVVLTNLFTSGLAKNLDGSIAISKEDFGILPGLVAPDVLQTIQLLPGVESVNESIADINIRGGSNDQNFVSWDGIRMYQTGHFFGLISAFNPQITDEVKVVKNGTGALYSEGVSGSVFMRADNRVQPELKGSIGSDLLATDGLLHVPLGEKVSLSVSGRFSLTGLYASPTYEKYFECSFENIEIDKDSLAQNSTFNFYDVSAKLNYQINEKHKFSASFLRLHNKLTYAEATNNEKRESDLSQQSIGVSANLESQWSDSWSTNVIAYYSKYNLDALDANITNEQSILQQNEVIEEGVKLEATYRLSNNLKWLNGYEFVETGALNSSEIVNPTYEIIQKKINLKHALFSEVTYAKNGFFSKAGVRLNYIPTLGKFLVEPRLNLSQKLGANFSLSLQGELKHQTITQFVDLNEDFLGVENRRWVNSDENVPIVQGKQASFGASFKNSGWYVSIDGFYKKVTDMVSESQGFQGQFQFDGAVGDAVTYGSEFLVNKNFGLKNTFWISHTWSNQYYDFPELSSGTFPGNFNVDQSFSSGLNYYITNNWSTSLGYQWRTGRHYTVPVDGQETYQDGNTVRVNYGEINTQQLNNYGRLDASLGYEIWFKKSQLQLKAGILNVLNRTNEISRFYVVDSNDSSKTIAVTKNSLGITPNVSLRYNF
ncbi:carboxypeptidase-like regulatory domain-containing protein [Galbibacter sp. BG1]|uniref:TonB-dependent receptor n=1 Tax=Galbibacter sp. BG1 TaxID=1170699 RepID=UPI0015C1252B|nr:carboxypeptidase-like regulatory domain-containing protein [Galbibacter sp. BG1]QLE00406.1 carboxypeptidase-like regulatory domain-containing protein [Galbibacter sp. BG1]